MLVVSANLWESVVFPFSRIVSYRIRLVYPSSGRGSVPTDLPYLYYRTRLVSCGFASEALRGPRRADWRRSRSFRFPLLSQAR